MSDPGRRGQHNTLSPFPSPFRSPFRSPLRCSPFKNLGHAAGNCALDLDCDDDDMNLGCFILMFDLILKQVISVLFNSFKMSLLFLFIYNTYLYYCLFYLGLTKPHTYLQQYPQVEFCSLCVMLYFPVFFCCFVSLSSPRQPSCGCRWSSRMTV